MKPPSSHVERSGWPVAIGGVGGSGTRVVAGLFRALEYYIGEDLNEANDNLWFTLLFKRRDVVVEPRRRLDSLARLFINRMKGLPDVSPSEREHVHLLAARPRLQHSVSWLQRRAHSFCDSGMPRAEAPLWAWKEPNTHIIIERLLELDQSLHYIHVVRNGLDMAFSQNQNQLQFWGPIFLNRDVQILPKDSLAYWCEAQKRILEIQSRFCDRTMVIKFEDFCENALESCIAIAQFAGIQADDRVLQVFSRSVGRPSSQGIFRSKDLAQFDVGDVQVVRQLGYPVT